MSAALGRMVLRSVAAAASNRTPAHPVHSRMALARAGTVCITLFAYYTLNLSLPGKRNKARSTRSQAQLRKARQVIDIERVRIAMRCYLFGILLYNLASSGIHWLVFIFSHLWLAGGRICKQSLEHIGMWHAMQLLPNHFTISPHLFKQNWMESSMNL